MQKLLVIPNGINIAIKRWAPKGLTKKSTIVATHGWMDNVSSFTYLGDFLSSNGYNFIALDLIGHGKSSHLHPSTPYLAHTYIQCVKATIDGIKKDKSLEPDDDIVLLGHSMGAGISLMLAGAFPEITKRLVLLDGFGPFTSTDDKSCSVLRKAIDVSLFEEHKDNRVFPHLKRAVDARIKKVLTYPGNQFISREAARLLVMRGVGVDEDPLLLDSDKNDESITNVTFKHDPRITYPSHAYYNNNQVLSFVENISAKTLLLRAEKGWPYIKADAVSRQECLEKKGLLTLETIAGSHHFHLDPETRAVVASRVLQFLQ
jgi:pimeloyl-ACP methyl ester carboxylesterase